ncbi:MAG: tRNA lysidine(34) synthetase TilS, partial [Anaeroplasmataceae bacterium]|nr:tRNA lysidine(34) synthetase TilS [Anaeroplasmataceae bacterium]
MLEKIKNFIKENHLFKSNEPIICAVSGGVDSLCLLHILHQLKYNVVLAHVNHHKREQSSIEQQAMQNLAESYNIPFELMEYYDDGLENFQSQAHQARYIFFKSLAKKYKTKWIATAHHLDDQAETILMRLISGSNLYGYAGISVQQQEKEYTLVRPLLCVSKEEIYQYATQENLSFFEDSSNQSDDYLRNRIRHHILPLLKKENENYLEKIQEFSVQAKQTFDFIRKQSINYLDKLNNNIDIASFKSLDLALRNDIICLLFERFELSKNKEIILKCVQLLEQNKNCKYRLKDEHYLYIEYGKAFIKKIQDISSFCEKIGLDETILILNQYKFYFSKKIPQINAKYLKLCYNDLKLPFLIRNKKEGDFIEMSYGNKKVSRLLIDEKIPVRKRNQIPLIFDQEGNLLWVYN